MKVYVVSLVVTPTPVPGVNPAGPQAIRVGLAVSATLQFRVTPVVFTPEAVKKLGPEQRTF